MAAISASLARGQFPRSLVAPVAPFTYSFQTTAGPAFTYPTNGNPLTMNGILKTGAPLIWNWGDGSPLIIATNPGNKTFAGNGPRTSSFTVVDGPETLTQLVIQGPNGGPSPFCGNGVGQNPYVVPLPDFSKFVNILQFLSCDTYWNGAFPVADMSVFPSLYHFDIQGNLFSSWPLFTDCPALSYVDMHASVASTTDMPDFTGCPSLLHLEMGDAQPIGAMASLAGLANLTYFSASSFSSGQMKSVAGCTALLTFSISGSWTGSNPVITDFSTCTALTGVSITTNDTGTVAGSFATQKNLASLYFYCNLTAAAVNQILHDLVQSLSLSGRVACSVNLAQPGNAAPTGQGIADKATLNGTAGWSVSTN